MRPAPGDRDIVVYRRGRFLAVGAPDGLAVAEVLAYSRPFLPRDPDRRQPEKFHAAGVGSTFLRFRITPIPFPSAGIDLVSVGFFPSQPDFGPFFGTPPLSSVGPIEIRVPPSLGASAGAEFLARVTT